MYTRSSMYTRGAERGKGDLESERSRALILGWAYYLDAFSSYPLRTWLPSVYRGHDNWYTRVKLPSAFALEDQSPSGPRKPLHASVTFWEAYAP
ncbi:hypothetical protein Droror1_Dr00028162 [Drosera rotundifolia]